MSRRRANSSHERLASREAGFDLSSCPHAKLREYNALEDPNMRHYFENTARQRHLYLTGQIDRHGRVIDLRKNTSKLHIIEKEFELAERQERIKQREEMEMRYRIQKKRLDALEKARRQEILSQVREDRELTKDILGIIRKDYGQRSVSRSSSRSRASTKSPGSSELGRSGFFITDSNDVRTKQSQTAKSSES